MAPGYPRQGLFSVRVCSLALAIVLFTINPHAHFQRTHVSTPSVLGERTRVVFFMHTMLRDCDDDDDESKQIVQLVCLLR